MRVSVVSTYPPVKDGIGQYVSFLYPNLAKLGVQVNVIADKSYPSDGGFVVQDIWHGTINLRATLRIIETTLRTSSEILHYQFHPALFGRWTNLVLLPLSMLLLRICSKKVVITFHTIRILSRSPGGDRAAVFFYTRLLALLSHGIVALTDEMKDLLVNEYKVSPNKIRIIPFGVREVSVDDPISAKRQVGLANRYCIFAPSLLRSGTGVDLVLRTMPKILQRAEDVVFVMATARPTFRSREDKFPEEVGKMISDHIKDNVLLLSDFDALDPKAHVWMAAADLLVYLHGNYASEDSSLGICEAIAYRKPVLISDAAKFRRMAAILRKADLGSFVIPVGHEDETTLGKRLLAEIARARQGFPNQKLANEYALFSQDNSWARIAETLLDLYRQIMENGRD